MTKIGMKKINARGEVTEDERASASNTAEAQGADH